MTFSVCRLLARLQSNKTTNAVTVGDLCVDFDNYHVPIGGYPILLTYKEFELLRFFLTHPGRAFSRAALLQEVWGQDYIGGVRTVDVHIRNLRAKLGYAYRDLIQTVRNVGYRCQIW
jgi:DNA-binding response OmpR family regulator